MTKIEALRIELKCREMVEGTRLTWWCVIRDPHTHSGYSSPPTLNMRRENYELAIGLIEGKPVWGNDIIFNSSGFDHYAINVPLCDLHLWSWNPPKPKTVMVELEYDIVVHAAGLHPDISLAITKACKKALEQLK